MRSTILLLLRHDDFNSRLSFVNSSGRGGSTRRYAFNAASFFVLRRFEISERYPSRIAIIANELCLMKRH